MARSLEGSVSQTGAVSSTPVSAVREWFAMSGLRNAICLFCLALLLAPSSSLAKDGRLAVVASIAPLADFARQVGGDYVDVTLLLPPGASPHTYEPTPRVIRKITAARVFIRVGAGLEFWADRLVTAANSGILRVTCTEGVELLQSDDREHAGEGHADPHVWLDPVLCMRVVEKIRDAFAKEDPAHADAYGRNAAAYTARLAALDREIAGRVGQFRVKSYITFHPAWSYFSRRYGLSVAGVIEEGPGREPGPRHLGAIISRLKAMKTKVVFAEPQFSPKVAEAIAAEAGARVLFLDPLGGQKGRETYIE
jgi:zinc transport system substrate-binding protein